MKGANDIKKVGKVHAKLKKLNIQEVRNCPDDRVELLEPEEIDRVPSYQEVYGVKRTRNFITKIVMWVFAVGVLASLVFGIVHAIQNGNLEGFEVLGKFWSVISLPLGIILGFYFSNK